MQFRDELAKRSPAEIRRLSEELIADFPDEPEARFVAAAAVMDDRSRFLELIEEAVALAPDDPHVRIRAAEIHHHGGSTEMAGRHLKQAADEVTTTRQDLLGMWLGAAAQLDLARGNHQRAEEALLQAHELEPDAQNHAAALAELYFATGRETEAHEVLDRCLALNPGDPRLTALRHSIAEQEAVVWGEQSTDSTTRSARIRWSY